MGFPRESGNGGDGEAHRGAVAGANQDRASSCYYSSSSSAGSAEGARSRQHGSEPPPTQQMERRSLAEEEGGCGGEPGRIPAAVFERDPSESNKDWSMMSTDSVFALQVAPSCDFTGFFLAHPELMDITTPPRASAAADADGRVHTTQFDSIPELGEATMQMQGHYSFAFPTLVEVKRHSSKNPQEEQPMTATMAKAVPTSMSAAAETAPAPAQTPVKTEMSSKPEETPAKVASKGGWLPCFPCC